MIHFCLALHPILLRSKCKYIWHFDYVLHCHFIIVWGHEGQFPHGEAVCVHQRQQRQKWDHHADCGRAQVHTHTTTWSTSHQVCLNYLFWGASSRAIIILVLCVFQDKHFCISAVWTLYNTVLSFSLWLLTVYLFIRTLSWVALTVSFPLFIRVTAELSLFEVTGLASNRPAPTLLSSRKAATGAGTPLLCILFETNPLDESANQRLHVESQPLEIIYDAVSGVCQCSCLSMKKTWRGDISNVFLRVCVDNGEQHVDILHASWRPAAGWAHQRDPHETGAV